MITSKQNTPIVKTLNDLAKQVDYSLLDTLTPDPKSTKDGVDHFPRQVFSGHFVHVEPTPIANPEYIAHSKTLFKELGFDDSLALSPDFIAMFSGDLSDVPEPIKKFGWACGYALSIYGREYYDQCPFKTGNGYGDGRAVSILEAVLNGKRWEMQLKGGGRTPYCRGADGRAVLRSSVREFLAQEHMHALGIPTSRSLSLYTSFNEKVQRPWYSEDSHSFDPDMLISENVAISTRVAPSFIRVGQLELFSRRTRKNEYLHAKEELEKLVLHLIDREYSEEIDNSLPIEEKVLLLAKKFRARLTSLVANWIRVGYCQGNFNGDNCPAGGYTLDYGPFGFCDMFDPKYQPWTGGGRHFAFLNQPVAANRNFYMFCTAIQHLLGSDENYFAQLNEIQKGFDDVMQNEMEKMWAKKLGLDTFNAELFEELETLMIDTSVDYTLFFRELSEIPENIQGLEKSFYNDIDENLQNRWSIWLEKWKTNIDINTAESREKLSQKMKQTNPKYTLREWILVPAYKKAREGDYSMVRELQEIMTNPYAEQSKEIEEKYYKKKEKQLFDIGGISHISCSS